MSFKYEQDARVLEAEDGMVWLAEVEVPTTTTSRLRITSNNEIVSYGKSISGEPNLYHPYPIQVGQIARQKKGDLPQIALTVSNARRMLPEILEAHNGLIGQPAIVRLVSLGDLENYAASLRFDGEIIGTEVSVETVTFTLGSYNAKSSKFPKERFIANHCRFRFGDDRCGYDVSHPLATYSTCPRTFEACEDRGDDEELVMLVARKHPENFGGWKGTPLG